MRITLTILLNLILLSFLSCQSNKIQIMNQLGSNHVNILPTKISLIPPEGFNSSSNFIGIENEESGIQIMEIDGAPFENSTRNLSRETFESKGIIVNSIDKVTVNGLKGYMLELEQEHSTSQLIFGDSTYTVMLIGSYPKQNKIEKEKIQKCLKSVYLNKELETNPFDVAKFELDLSKTNLEFYQYGANHYIYNSDKLESAYDHPEGATLTISQLPNDPSIILNLEEYTIGVFNKMASEIEGLKILEQNALMNESTESYYILSNSDSIEKDLHLYISMIISDETSFLVNIISFSGLNNNMKNAIESVQQLRVKNSH